MCGRGKNMKTLSLIGIFVILVILSGSAFGQQPTPAATPPVNEDTVKITTSLIQLDVVVTDKAGNPVTDLRPEDFKIYQDGKLQTVTNLSYINSQTAAKTVILSPKVKRDKKEIPTPPTNVRSAQGRIVTFILDDGNCMATPGGAFSMRDAITKFVDEQMLPDDRIAIYRTAPGVSLLQAYTSNKQTLRQKIKKISLASPFACSSTFEPSSDNANGKPGGQFDSVRDLAFKEAAGAEQRNKKITDTIGVLNFVVDRLVSVPQRKIVFMLSEGVIAGDASVRDALRFVTEKAGRASVVINTMSTKGVTIPGMIEAQDSVNTNDTSTLSASRAKEVNQLNEGLAYIADATGGSFVHDSNFLGAEVKKLLDKQTAYYLLGYEPEDETFKGKKFHNIEVKLVRDDLRVSSREGFYGNTETAQRPVYRNADSPLYQAIDSPLQDTGMEIGLTILHGNSAANGDYIRPLFHIKGEDLTFTDDKDGSKKVVVDVVAVTLDEKGVLSNEFNLTYATRIPKEAVSLAMQNGLDFSTDMLVKKPGVYNFKIAVRDNISKRLASAGDYVEIADIRKKDFSISGLVTTGADANGLPMLPKSRTAEGAFALVPSVTVPSIRQYNKGDVLYYTYTIYNAKIDPANRAPNLTRQIKLFSNGKLVMDGAETSISASVPTDPVRIENFGNINITNAVESGEYVLQVIVKDKIANRVSTQWIDFEVIP